jgi:subtilisin family serine protease
MGKTSCIGLIFAVTDLYCAPLISNRMAHSFSKLVLSGLFSSIFALNAFGFQSQIQLSDSTELPNNWFLLDPEADKIQGLSVEKAYNTLLKGKPSRTVIVAVIDTGVDFNHEDLKDVMWINTKEIAGNGLDDDKNGYIDDIYGWNFIGGTTGNVKHDTYEVTREYIRLKSKFDGVDEKKVSKKDKSTYAYWLTIQEKYVKNKTENETNYKSCVDQLAQYKSFHKNISEAVTLLKSTYKIETIKPEIIDTLKTNDPKLRFAKYILGMIYQSEGRDVQPEALIEELEYVLENNAEVCDHYKSAVEYGYNVDFNPRQLVGDNYENAEERIYGNSDVKGTGPVHGTHVAGIIGANRNNDIGIKGIADNVKIMALRAVPNGDERDKDIANAIRYAVDNGANIINMSFGKSLSPQKDAVDKAVRYAESKGVLLIHGAGNENANNDTESNFPNRFYKDGQESKTWIDVGASAWGADPELVASFSNFGKKSVDLFAPGVQIYSTTPNNTYKAQDGTSMASPATAGVAAIIMSYFPELTAAQVRDVLRQSTRKFDNLKVQKPGSSELIDFSELSITGGLLNAYEAVKLASTIKGKPAEK